jgi:hypothetical protein
MNYIIAAGRIICPGEDKRSEEKSDFSKLETVMSADTNKQKINVDSYLYAGKSAKKTSRLSDLFLCSISIFNAVKKKTADEAFDYYLTSLLKSSMHINQQNWYYITHILLIHV